MPLRRRYNRCMRLLFILTLSAALASAQGQSDKSASQAVTVAATIDHNRVIINADLALPNGSNETVRVWVDNGNPDLELSRRLATTLGLALTCGDQECSALPAGTMTIGGMTIPLSGLKEARVPLRPVTAASVLASGMKAEINLPSSILRHYDVLIDFPKHRFTIGPPGSIHFLGSSGKVQINGQNGLIQVPSKIENKKYNLALDVGSCISFLSEDLFGKLANAHPNWPHMIGAVGSANMWGAVDEAKWKVMRLDRVEFGPLFLDNVATVALPASVVDFFQKRASMPTAGVLGANALQNYRIGLDYAHSTVYFDIGRTFNFPDFDVIGLVLRPEDNGQFTILDVAEFDGKPSVDEAQAGDQLVAINDLPIRGSTMGQVWAALGGNPGQERRLTIERAGKHFAITARVQHFLAEVPDEKESKKKK